MSTSTESKSPTFLSHEVTKLLQNRKMEIAPESRVLDERQGVVFRGNLAWQVAQPTWRRGNFGWVAEPGAVPDVLIYTWEMSTLFNLLGDLEVLCPKIYKAKQRLHLSRVLRKRGFSGRSGEAAPLRTSFSGKGRRQSITNSTDAHPKL